MTDDRMKDILGALLTHLGLEWKGIAVTHEQDGVIRMDIDSPHPSRIIGWHGETLNALQHLLKSMLRTLEKLERSPFIILDTDGYRKMQEEKVCKIAEQKADFVRRTGSRIALAPMSPYFRRIVHLYVANNPALKDLTTESVGEGDYRQIVMRMKEEKHRAGEELSPVISQDDGLENLDV
ncbi:KH domain-containing protein [Candidatus Peregrinibacteria bacterium]|nr:KH domain-containing protein [Candidatus Peregrinibacteria bacterium]